MTRRSRGGSSRRDFLRKAAGGAAATVAAGSLPGALASPAAAGSANGTALIGGSVLDVDSGRVHHDMTVVIRADRIVDIGRRHEVDVSPTAEQHDLAGKYVIPGLWDMHVHSFYERIDLPLFVVNGVTGVREMWGQPHHHDWVERIEDGSLLGPRYVLAGPLVDGKPSLWGGSGAIAAGTEAEGRAAVQQSVDEGADFVKVYSRLEPNVFLAIADECKKHDIPFAGHVPDEVSAPVASTAGMRSMEHLFGMWFAMSSEEQEIRELIRQIDIEPGDFITWFASIHPLEWRASNSFSATKAARLFVRLIHDQTWTVPTFNALRGIAEPDVIPVGPERLKYIPDWVEAQWKEQRELYASWRTPEQAEQARVLYRRLSRLVGSMDRAHVPLLAGTDTNNPFCLPGFGLHDELELLVDAGLSPLRALRAATTDPARFLGMDDICGAVEPGKRADLVVLDANPLEDIRNTTAIDSVVVRGRVISSEERARILAKVEAAADEPPPTTSDGQPLRVTCPCAGHATGI